MPQQGLEKLASPAELELIYLISREKLGRRRLAQRTGLSEMRIRLELDKLRGSGYVTLDKSGVTLTDKGKRQFYLVLHKVRKVSDIDLSIDVEGLVCQAAVLSYFASRPAWFYRDLVIRQGASALMMLCYGQEGWFFIDSGELFGVRNPDQEHLIGEAFGVGKKGDLLLIVSAPDVKSCGLGLWKVVGEILSEKA